MKIRTEKVVIEGIPAIVWGETSDKVFIHVHGKMSCKENAETMAEIAEMAGYQTISFDLPEHGERKNHTYRCDVWNGVRDLKRISDYAFSGWKTVSLYACSLGAYFSLNAYADLQFEKCCFQSPIVNMEYLIRQMFRWFEISEERLEREGEIDTPVDALRWDYFTYVREHPTDVWKSPTSILFGGKDDMQTLEIMQCFAERNHCRLTVSPESSHPFMEERDCVIVTDWLRKSIG